MKLNELRKEKTKKGKKRQRKSGEHMDSDKVLFSIICRMKLTDTV